MLTPCILESPFAAPRELRDKAASTREAMFAALEDPDNGTYYRDWREAQLAVQAAEAKHRRYLKALARHAFDLGYAPFASHALYTQWLDDNDPAERKLGIDAGFAIAAGLDRDARTLVVLVGVDLGISPGMQLGIEHHKRKGRDIREVTLGPSWGRKPQLQGAREGLLERRKVVLP